jgi:hypothetical protein|nr:MAG TPA: hypothetical protein [Caudoviricetes sp.]
MDETTVAIPNADPSSLLTSIVSNAKTFETLGITGVLFILVIALGFMLVFKLRNDTKLTNIATQLSALATATSNANEMNKELNSSNMKFIEHYLETIKQALDKLEGYILDIKERHN